MGLEAGNCNLLWTCCDGMQTAFHRFISGKADLMSATPTIGTVTHESNGPGDVPPLTFCSKRIWNALCSSGRDPLLPAIIYTAWSIAKRTHNRHVIGFQAFKESFPCSHKTDEERVTKALKETVVQGFEHSHL